MNTQTLLKTGIIGSIIAALCCFTPILVILLGVLGLSAWIGWLDFVLIPVLIAFVGITIYALYRRQREVAACCEVSAERKTRERDMK